MVSHNASSALYSFVSLRTLLTICNIYITFKECREFERPTFSQSGSRNYKDTGREIVTILCGGDKSTQQNNIKKAKRLALEEEKDDEDK